MDGSGSDRWTHLHREGRCVLVWNQSVGVAHSENPVRWHAADAGKASERG